MRVLLDENVPHRVRRLLEPHEVVTVTYLGWKGIKNGKLLALMARDGFAALVTFDKALPTQQNLVAAGVGVIVLDVHPIRYRSVYLMAPAVLRALAFLEPGQVVTVTPDQTP